MLHVAPKGARILMDFESYKHVVPTGRKPSWFSDLVRGADAARRKWSTSIVGGDFTVPH